MLKQPQQQQKKNTHSKWELKKLIKKNGKTNKNQTKTCNYTPLLQIKQTHGERQ